MKRIIGIALLALVAWGVISSNMPATTDAAGKAARLSVKPAAAPPKPLLDKSDAAQSKRADLIRELIAKGIFQKVDTPGSLPRVYVRPAFYDLDFDMKQSFVSVVYAYHFDGSNAGDMVRVFDSRSNKPVGSYSALPGGLSLD